ncbi:hypothetical protein J421_2309 [Gemmatirosa kalamazoonensis]|uniref:Uncharacterized protein n=1 Tax=Gemmatirosa kalamazoonensis TaxID=861299 RepID=W0RGE3_9BACT|nr:hypothetical protein J421_2309 [Gemmatirosa kalamazoonensis]
MAAAAGGGDSTRGAGNGAPGLSLPEHLRSLISPDVLVARRAVVQVRATDPHDLVRRRRVAEIVANSLLEDFDDAA